MTRRMKVIRILLYAYPAIWRVEYGSELAYTLARRPLTPSIVLDVTRNGILQRMRSAAAWQLGGIWMAGWLIFGTALNSVAPLSPWAYQHFFQLDLCVGFAVGYFSVSRHAQGLLRAAWASAKASIVGLLPEVLLAVFWAAGLVHPTVLGMNGAPVTLGHGITDLVFRSDVVVSPAELLLAVPLTFFPALVIGFAGAVTARIASALRRSRGRA